jgi:glycosyltransferase involved in cell wall biosynthesis
MSKNELKKDRLHEVKQTFGEPVPLYLQLTYMYVPAWGYGGPVRLLFDYARWMSSNSDVTVFTSDIHHDLTRITAKSETISGVPIERHKLFFPALTKRGVYLISPLMCLRAAQRIRSSRGPAIVHFSELRGPVPLYALLLKVLFGKRVTLVHSAFGSLHYKRGWRRRIYDALFIKAFVRLVDLRLVQNGHEGEAYGEICREHGPENESKTVLLPLHMDEVPEDPARYTESGKKRAAVRDVRRTYGIPENALVFLFLGRLHPAKGILRMMDAFLEFSRSCSRQTLLLVVGRDDGFQARVEEYIALNRAQAKIRVINNVYENRFDYYFLADVFLGFPTIFEETMLASIEAMACATPIVVSREADIPFVENEQAGLVIDFDVRTAAESMGTIAESLGSFQGNARRVVARHFNGAAASAKFLMLFQMAKFGNLYLQDDESTDIQPASLDENTPVESASEMAAGNDHALSRVLGQRSAPFHDDIFR